MAETFVLKGAEHFWHNNECGHHQSTSYTKKRITLYNSSRYSKSENTIPT